jgi:hypothetical protein
MQDIDCIELAARLRAGFGLAAPAAAGPTGTLDVAVGERRAAGLYAAPGHALAFALPAEALHFAFRYGLLPETWGRADFAATRFRVLVDGTERFAATVDATDPDQRRWHEAAILLEAGRAGRELRLEAAPAAMGDCAWGVWADARLLRLRGPLPGPAARLADRELEAHRRGGEVARLRASGSRKLNLGAGGFPLEGWINVDGGDGRHYDAPEDPRVIRLDVFEALAALPDGSMDFIASEQFFEHFTRQEGLAMAREFRRVLSPAGVLRIQVPDLESVVALYRNELAFADWGTVQLPHRLRHVGETRDPYGRLAPGEAFTPAIMINNGFHMDGHRFLYDFATLAQTLRLAGFAKVVRAAFGESAHAALRGIDRHDGGSTGAAWVPRVALVVEASA